MKSIFAIFVHYSWKIFKIVIERYVIDYVVVSLIGILWRKFVYFFFLLTYRSYKHITIICLDLHRKISVFILFFNTVEKYEFTKVDVYKDARVIGNTGLGICHRIVQSFLRIIN